jgi:nicotinic acid phosphoribosyltransferase
VSGLDADRIETRLGALEAKIDRVADVVRDLAGAVGHVSGRVDVLVENARRRWSPAHIAAVGTAIGAVFYGASHVVLALSAGGASIGAASPAAIDAAARALEAKQAAAVAAERAFGEADAGDLDADATAPAGVPVSSR